LGNDKIGCRRMKNYRLWKTSETYEWITVALYNYIRTKGVYFEHKYDLRWWYVIIYFSEIVAHTIRTGYSGHECSIICVCCSCWINRSSGGPVGTCMIIRIIVHKKTRMVSSFYIIYLIFMIYFNVRNIYVCISYVVMKNYEIPIHAHTIARYALCSRYQSIEFSTVYAVPIWRVL